MLKYFDIAWTILKMSFRHLQVSYLMFQSQLHQNLCHWYSIHVPFKDLYPLLDNCNDRRRVLGVFYPVDL